MSDLGNGTAETHSYVSDRHGFDPSLLARGTVSPTPAPSTAEQGRMFDRAALVACHPDDEVLWFSSVIGRIPQVIVAYSANRLPHITQGRLQSLAVHPKAGLVALGLAEAGCFGLGGRRPKPTPYGIEIANPAISAAYRANYGRLLDLLRPLLKDRRNVYTHDPWGEYGHPEHIQMYCAVRQLQQEFGFCLWFSNYVSKRAKRLHTRLAPSIRIGRRAALATDLRLARQVQQLYVGNHCWTWYSSYRWPEAEELLAQESGSTVGTLVSEYSPIMLDQLLAPADRFRWARAATRREFEASSAGRFLSSLVGRIWYARVRR